MKMPDSRFQDSRATLSNSYPHACVPCKETLRTIFMMVFGLTRPGTFSVVSCRSLYIIGKFGKVKRGIILEM